MISYEYYQDLLHYHDVAKYMHEKCNLGTEQYPHVNPFADTLAGNVQIYDCVQRKYAGFGQVIVDLRHHVDKHPYRKTMSDERKALCDSFNNVRDRWELKDWLYVFAVHRLTGSGINYSLNPSGYCNSILPEFASCRDWEDMVHKIKCNTGRSIYTSKGYQIPMFPKHEPDLVFQRAGDRWMAECLPEFLDHLIDFFSEKGFLWGTSTYQQTLDRIEQYVRGCGWKFWKFVWAAWLGDVSDYFPDLIDRSSEFPCGTNAIKTALFCGAKSPSKAGEVLMKFCEDTGLLPCDAEDVMCDYVRWVENYIPEGPVYEHLDRNTVWNSSRIEKHPDGRQRWKLSAT